MIRILVDFAIDEQRLDELRSRPGVDLRVVPVADAPRELPAKLIGDVEVLLCSCPPSNFAEMRQVRWVQIASSGYSQLYPHQLAERQIRATNARGCFDVPIAEWNLAMMVNLIRDLPQMQRNQQARIWDRAANFQRELRGMTVGFWGYGGLARETARIAKLMGMRVHVLTRSGVHPAPHVYRVRGTGDPDGTLPDLVFSIGDRSEFFQSLNFLIFAMPLTSQTEGIAGDDELQALRRAAFVLNPARGGLIREQSLLRALRERWIQGAAIDTHYAYPLPPDHPLWAFPNVILTPHISGSTLNPMFRERLWEVFEQNVDHFLQNAPLINELSAEQLRGN